MLAEADKYDLVLMDLASSEGDESGLACPPAKFATRESIELARQCLKSKGMIPFVTMQINHLLIVGVFSMNLVTRDEELLAKVKGDITNVFANTFVINEVGEQVVVTNASSHVYRKKMLMRCSSVRCITRRHGSNERQKRKSTSDGDLNISTCSPNFSRSQLLPPTNRPNSIVIFFSLCSTHKQFYYIPSCL